VHTNHSAGAAPKRNAQSLWDYLLAQAGTIQP
jgi:hypothetical protein